MRRSIRWELPLSYVAIALLATVALGVVLLLILRGYYGRLERAYLEGNALAFSYALAPLLEDDLPAESLQSQVVSLSFLSQARVRLLDKAGTPVADSSIPGRFAVSLAAVPERELSLPARGSEADAVTRSLIAINPVLGIPEELTLTETLPSRLIFDPSRSGGPYAPLLMRSQPVFERPFPLGLWSDAAQAGPRSSQAVQQPVYRDTSDLLGYVELSDGPAYSQEIVANVARGWALAGGLAVALAAAVGWLASRRISAPVLGLTSATARMAAGDLTARAHVERRDEFGTLARSFNTMAQRVEDTVVTLRRFVSDAAHELNTPLTTLRTNLELVTEDSPLEQRERLGRAQAQIQRLEVLTRGMLDLSRIEAGMDRDAGEPVSLTTLARELGELYASRAEQIGLDFELSLPETPIAVQGDEVQLRQALTNLLDNAVKFTPEGGSIHLGLRRQGDAVVVWVEDTGIGIPEQDLPLLFQRFHRGRNTEGYAGSGLGLAIVKAIADEHDGHVNAETTGRGSRFSLQLPLAGVQQRATDR